MNGEFMKFVYTHSTTMKSTKKKKTPEPSVPVTPEIVDATATLKKLKEKIKSTEDELERLSKQYYKVNEVVSELQTTKDNLQASVDVLEARWKEESLKQDFILPENFIKDVYDCVSFARRKHGSIIVMGLTLYKESIVRKLFGKNRKRVYTEDVEMHSFSYVDHWRTTQEWSRVISYENAVRKAICRNNKTPNNDHYDWLKSADDALLSADSHVKDAFILKSMELHKNGKL